MATHPPTRRHPRPHSKQARPSQHMPPVEKPVSSETQTDNQSGHQFPPLIVRDFVDTPRPPLLIRPIDEKWVVNIMLPPGTVPGIREREAIRWEATHWHLYRTGGNRADPPNAIPKTWGGLSKAEDEEMMRRAQARVKKATEWSLGLGLTPTEPDLGAPPQNYSAMTDDEREAYERVEASIQQQIADARMAGYGPLIETPPNTPPPLLRSHARIFSPSYHPATPPTTSPERTSKQGSKRKCEESDNEHADSKADSSGKRAARTRRAQKQDEDNAAMDTKTSRYLLRPRVPSSSSRTSSTKPTASSKGKGKARAP